ncbi:MAG: hypothetical protein NTX48_14445 [Planctomycetales bacterium]|nr:hypothetical protein [Planctomycetales bacterium]
MYNFKVVNSREDGSDAQPLAAASIFGLVKNKELPASEEADRDLLEKTSCAENAE